MAPRSIAADDLETQLRVQPFGRAVGSCKQIDELVPRCRRIRDGTDKRSVCGAAAAVFRKRRHLLDSSPTILAEQLAGCGDAIADQREVVPKRGPPGLALADLQPERVVLVTGRVGCHRLDPLR